jgi:ribosomal protein L31
LDYKSHHHTRIPMQGTRCRPAGFLIVLTVVVLGVVSSGWSYASAGPDTSWFVDMNRYAASAHGALACDKCHEAVMEEGEKHPRTDNASLLDEATRNFDYGRCAGCHATAVQRTREGAHAKALAEELASSSEDPKETRKAKAPVCGDCHSAHYAPSGRSRLETGKAMVETCGTCHPAHRASYLADFHGRAAVKLGNTRSAYCSDCHGAHRTMSLKEKDPALRACLRCHPEADEGFAQVVIHASLDTIEQKEQEKKESLILVHRVRVVAFTVVALVLVFFFGHSFLWIMRELHEKLRNR